jgi:hypothetical protein
LNDPAKDSAAPDADARAQVDVARSAVAPDSPADAASDGAPFCARKPILDGSYCTDFDSYDAGHKAFGAQPSNGATVSVVSGDSPSPPNSALVDIPAPLTVASAVANVAFVAPKPSQLACEFEWIVDLGLGLDASADDTLDIFSMEFYDGLGGLRSYNLFQRSDGRVGFYQQGTFSEVRNATAGWTHGSLTISTSGWIDLVVNETVVPRITIDPMPSLEEARVYAGAVSMHSAPWKVRFDNLYCDVQ